MRLGSDGADSYYTLQVQASVTRVLEDGSRREELVTFAFLLVYSDSLDLEAEFQMARSTASGILLLFPVPGFLHPRLQQETLPSLPGNQEAAPPQRCFASVLLSYLL